jgi:hypothetical protein
MAMDVVDYEIRGAEMQFVEVELDPGEAAVGEAGSMMFMDAGITMDTVFGDGSAAASGLIGKLLSAGKRLVTGNPSSPPSTPTPAAPRRAWPSRRRTRERSSRWICPGWAVR